MSIDLLILAVGVLAGLLGGLLGLGGGLILTPLLTLIFQHQGLAAVAPLAAAATAQASGAVNLTMNLILRSRHFEPVPRTLAAVVMIVGALGAFLAPRFLAQGAGLEVESAFVLVSLLGAALQAAVLIWPSWRSTEPRAAALAGVCALSSTLGTAAGMGGGVLVLPSAQLLGYRLHQSITLTGYLAVASLWLGTIGYALTPSPAGSCAVGLIHLPAAGLIVLGSLPGLWIGIQIAKRQQPRTLRISALLLMAGVGVAVALRSL